MDVLTGAVGGHTKGWITNARADQQCFRNAGLGVQYSTIRYTYHGDVDKLSGQVAYKGFPILLSFLS